jgi:predicted house-cleaning noncanonical NTP pyrophosphatase (MazG superfamily)
MKKIYNKLIRDRIPEIIENAGETPKIKKLNKKDFKIELQKKVLEEAKELVKTKNKKELIGEIVDVSELIDWLLKELKVSKAQLKSLQIKKNKERGSFKKQLFLIEIIIKK